eukprot:m.506217 g.506217  ORF g.506217 m.506217 type:complete len:737 (+) comp21873_c0_seq4:28-2238(+)
MRCPESPSMMIQCTITRLLFVTIFVCCMFERSASQPDFKPHIIFLLPDDLGFNNVPWNSHSVNRGKLPHLEKLAEDSLFLTNAYVQRWCTPTRAALMTGRYPFRNGWNQYSTTFAEELSSVPLAFEMMPAMLKRGGYAAHMLGKWHLGHFTANHTPVGRGFDTYFGFLLGSETHDTHNSWGKHTCNIPVTDLFNGTQPANESVHYRNLTYSPEMYGMLMHDLVIGHTNASVPFFLYMAFQNNHAPYTQVEQYMRRFPDLTPGGTMQTYNGDMAALDDAVGQLLDALDANARVFKDRTLIVVSQDNGGPARIANNVPLRGAKFGLWEGSVRNNAILWGPGVLPAGTGGRHYHGIVHLVDWWTTFAHLANVSVIPATLPGFELPDGVNQWPALIAAAAGEECFFDSHVTSGHSPVPPTCPRSEVVLDLNPEGNYVALRYRDFKIIWGKVGVADVIADIDYDCSDCCPLRRHFPATPGTDMCTAAAAVTAGSPKQKKTPDAQPDGYHTPLHPRAYWEPHEHYTVTPGALCASRASPCVFNVVTDVNESHNLFGVAAYKAVVDDLLARVDAQLNRTFNHSIDHTNVTAAQYCTIVQEAKWVKPFGYAPPPPPPSPAPPWLSILLVGKWQQPNHETFEISRKNSSTFVVTTVSCPGCCWSMLAAQTSVSPDNVSTITARGPAPECAPTPYRFMVGTVHVPNSTSLGWDEDTRFGNPAPTITWVDGASYDTAWAVWTKMPST